jgi:hypothetical protein
MQAYTDRPPSLQRPLQADQIQVSLFTKLEMLVPNVGWTEDPDNQSVEFGGPANTKESPDTDTGTPIGDKRVATGDAYLRGSSLIVKVGGAEEARSAVSMARSYGISQLWIDLVMEANDPRNDALIRDAVEAGKASNVAVVPVISLLQRPRRPTGSGGSLKFAQDMNILQEPGEAWATRRAKSFPATNSQIFGAFYENAGDWVLPTQVASTAAIIQSVKRITHIKGVSALALRNPAAPGYALPDPQQNFSLTPGSDFGYTPDMRLSFLKQYGYDPVDLVGDDESFNVPGLSLPFFRDRGRIMRQAARDWNTFRYNTSAKFLSALYDQVQVGENTVPILIERRSNSMTDPTGIYELWSRPDTSLAVKKSLRPAETGLPQRVSSPASLRSQFVRLVYQPFGFPNAQRPEIPPDVLGRFAEQVRSTADHKEPGTGSLIIDLSWIKFNEVGSVLAFLQSSNEPLRGVSQDSRQPTVR